MEAELNPTSSIIQVRPYRRTDLNFILDSWLKTLRNNNPVFKLIDRDIYFDTYPKVIESILSHSTCNIACLQEDDDVILGYIVTELDRLHWIFIKQQWRNHGIMKTLINHDIKSISHITNNFLPIMRKHKWILNPFL